MQRMLCRDHNALQVPLTFFKYNTAPSIDKSDSVFSVKIYIQSRRLFHLNFFKMSLHPSSERTSQTGIYPSVPKMLITDKVTK